MRPFLVFLFILLLLAFEGNCFWWRRRSRTCHARNCGVSHWSSWSSCSHQCGLSGVQTRTRYKIRTESCGGRCPYSFKQTRACNRNNCGNRGRSWWGRCLCNSCWKGTCCNIARRRNCLVSSWSSWSSCSHQCGLSGVQTRTRRKIRTESCGGSCPYGLKQTRACNRNKCGNRGRSWWGRCLCNSCWTGTCCNIARRRNCLVSSWTSWNSCNHQCGRAGVQTRTRYKTRTESCGGSCSYSFRQTKACNRNKCHNGGRATYGRCICSSCWTGTCCNIARRRNCVPGQWSSWSSCNHQCGNAGVQTRTRGKITIESCGGSCSFSFSQTKICNRNKCQNGGTPSYGKCICKSGWKGTCCAIKAGVCDHGPCKNGGSCLVHGNSYKCICLPDFIGAHCEKVVPNPCKPNPCKNGGQCNVLGNIYTCKCKPTFGGNNCEHSQTICSASGDPHYTSFDGKKFDFMGDCEYEFAKDCSKNKLFTVRTKNVACGWRVTCTAAVDIIIAGYFIQLTRERGTAAVNGVKQTKFPISSPGFTITNPSRSWLVLTTDIGMSVNWNFWTEVKVTISGKYKGMICNTSLCGNNNGRQDDDHLYSRECAQPPTLCIPDSKKRAIIDKCHLMNDRSSPFHGACNRYFDPANLISNCKYDACRCTDPMKCVCNAFAAYSKLCVEYGGLIDWRFKGTYLYPKLKECEQTCSNKGEIFTECGSACAKTCRDISRGLNCSETCIPGCHCPKGSYLDDKNHCVPMKKCTCFFEGKYYKAGENVKVGRCKTCTCNMGAMACVEDRDCSTKGPCESFPCKNDGVCNEKGNNFTCNCTKEYQGKTCEELKPKPCDSRPCKNKAICTNMGDTFSCECADGFKGKTCGVGVCDDSPCKNGGSCLVDGNSYKCVCLPDFIGIHCEKEVPNPCKPNPCKNGGQCNVLGNSYTCKCKPAFGGNNCEHSQTTCSASGDPHYTSFDGKRFDFMGDCEYEFAKDCSKNKLFTVLTKNVRCGRRVTCTAAVKIIIAGYFIQLTRERGTVVVNGIKLKKFPIIRPGFKITNPSWSWLIITADIGMTVSWNFGSYVKVTVSGKYKGMICNTSLCGNNNGRQDDDHHYSRKCAPPPIPCIPDSKKKAVIDKCHLMNDRSSPFHGACNRYFDPANLISNCKYDACRCTDPMKCVCNAFAAYSKLCVEYGGLIDWRFKGTYLYPKLKECEQTCSNKGEIFTECGSACAKTCRDISRGIKCSETCIPGCHCPKGSYLDDKNHCVPMKNCSCFFEGKYYKAGENVKVGRCKTCTCNMGAMACVEDRNCSSKGPCESFPCKNDGVCIEEGNRFTCICTKEYQGKTCEELKPTPCDSGPCKNNGTCTNKGDNFTCECADGFEGKTCEVMNACAKEPCKNDGVCASNGSSYQCECKFGFIGKNCQYMDACGKEPCQNNGTCTSVGSSYKCNCTSGFNGTNCEVMIISSYKECRQYQLLNESTRNVEYRHGGSLQCDYHLTKGWYRFSGGAGTKMPESCVPKNRCGTHASGWLNGTHPTVDEGIVTRKVCYHWVRKCCDWSNDIKVINCGPYFIYKLVPTFGCYFRYCGTD